jgi:hypothetical protein
MEGAGVVDMLPTLKQLIHDSDTQISGDVRTYVYPDSPCSLKHILRITFLDWEWKMMIVLGTHSAKTVTIITHCYQIGGN